MNNKFKSEINKWSANDLRCQPIGRDKLGQNYWYHLDEDCNLRVYREDLDDETWEVVAEYVSNKYNFKIFQLKTYSGVLCILTLECLIIKTKLKKKKKILKTSYFLY